MKRYGRSQTDEGEVLEDCCDMTSALGTLSPRVMLLQLPPSSDASSVECGSC